MFSVNTILRLLSIAVQTKIYNVNTEINENVCDFFLATQLAYIVQVKLLTTSCWPHPCQKEIITCTLQPLYNMVRYNTVLDITRFKDGTQKCIDYIEK